MEAKEREALYVLIGELEFLLKFYSDKEHIPIKFIQNSVNEVRDKLNEETKK